MSEEKWMVEDPAKALPAAKKEILRLHAEVERLGGLNDTFVEMLSNANLQIDALNKALEPRVWVWHHNVHGNQDGELCELCESPRGKKHKESCLLHKPNGPVPAQGLTRICPKCGGAISWTPCRCPETTDSSKRVKKRFCSCELSCGCDPGFHGDKCPGCGGIR